MRTEQAAEPATEGILAWRRDQLVGSGFAPSLARAVAEDERYDLHALIELVERGCSPDLAVRILAPLEREEAA